MLSHSHNSCLVDRPTCMHMSLRDIDNRACQICSFLLSWVISAPYVSRAFGGAQRDLLSSIDFHIHVHCSALPQNTSHRTRISPQDHHSSCACQLDSAAAISARFWHFSSPILRAPDSTSCAPVDCRAILAVVRSLRCCSVI